MDDIQITKEKRANRLGDSVEDPIYTEAEQLLCWSKSKNNDFEIILQRFTQRQSDTVPLIAFDKLKLVGAEDSKFRHLATADNISSGVLKSLNVGLPSIDLQK